MVGMFDFDWLGEWLVCYVVFLGLGERVGDFLCIIFLCGEVDCGDVVILLGVVLWIVWVMMKFFIDDGVVGFEILCGVLMLCFLSKIYDVLFLCLFDVVWWWLSFGLCERVIVMCGLRLLVLKKVKG